MNMARNKYPGHCYCCGAYVPPGYGHFERIPKRVPWDPRWRIKCVKCASGRILTDDDPGVKWAQKAAKEEAARRNSDQLRTR